MTKKGFGLVNVIARHVSVNFLDSLFSVSSKNMGGLALIQAKREEPRRLFTIRVSLSWSLVGERAYKTPATRHEGDRQARVCPVTMILFD